MSATRRCCANSPRSKLGTVIAVRDALEAGDLSAAEREVHSLKGAAAALGAVALSEAASDVEAALKAGTDVDETLPVASECS